MARLVTRSSNCVNVILQHRPTRKERTVKVTLILDTTPDRGSAASADDEAGAPQTKARREKRKKLNNIGADETYSCRIHRIYRQQRNSNGEKGRDGERSAV